MSVVFPEPEYPAMPMIQVEFIKSGECLADSFGRKRCSMQKRTLIDSASYGFTTIGSPSLTIPPLNTLTNIPSFGITQSPA